MRASRVRLRQARISLPALRLRYGWIDLVQIAGRGGMYARWLHCWDVIGPKLDGC